MPNRNMVFNPELGLLDSVAYQSKPPSGTGSGSARDQIQGRMNELKNHINKFVSMQYDDTGAANAYAITMDSTVTSYSAGIKASFPAAHANTGASTLNITPFGGTALGAIAIKKNGNQDLAAGDILAGQIIEVEHDGTYFQLLSGANLETQITNLTTDAIRDRGFNLDIVRCSAQNVVQIATCESGEGWANAGNGTYSNDATNFKTGSAGAKFTVASSNTYSGQSLTKEINLSKFSDGSASSTSDYITFDAYIDSTSLNNLASDGIYILFMCDAPPTTTNFFNKPVSKSSLVAGWNYIKIQKSMFISSGSPDWANVKWMITENGTAPTGAVSVTIDNIQMVRKDPSSNIPNPFQHYESSGWVRDMIAWSGEWFIGKEFGDIVCRELSGTANNSYALQHVNTYKDCEICFKGTIKTAGDANLFSWYFDPSNFIVVYSSTNYISLAVYVGGALIANPSASIAMPVGDIIQIKLTKYKSTIEALVYKNGVLSATLGGNANLDYNGSIYLAAVSSKITTINHFSVAATIQVSNAAVADTTKANATMFNAGAFTNDTLPLQVIGIDETNGRLYIKYRNGTVHYATLT
ncbi:MAG: hypothetical protein ACM3KR_00685 [Deltaproteobacteria bacterium]